MPWEKYPFPPAPSGEPTLTEIGDELADAPKIASLTADGHDPNTSLVTGFDLTSKIEVGLSNWAPGTLDVYLDDMEGHTSELATCAFYMWGSACGSGTMTVGQGRLAAFHLGQSVQVRVVPRHFTGPAPAWRVDVKGR